MSISEHPADLDCLQPPPKQSYTDLLKNAGKSKSSSSSSSKSKGKGKAKEETEPVGLTRQEKAARRRDALFREGDDEPSSGAFALAKSMKASMGQQTSTSKSASPRPSTSSSNTPRPGSPASALSKKRHLDVPSNLKSSSLSRTSSNSSMASNASASAPAGSARDRLKAGFKANDLQKLYTVKRDTRTIEEIERDIRAKKALTSSSTPATSKPTKPSGTRPSGLSASSSSKPSAQRRRSRSPSTSSDSSTETSDTSSSARRHQHRKKRSKKQGKGDLNEQQRSAIWQLMGKNRDQYVARDMDSDDDSSDMEATGAAVLEEERRAYVHLLLLSLSLKR